MDSTPTEPHKRSFIIQFGATRLTQGVITYQEGPLTIRLVNSLNRADQGAVGQLGSTFWLGIIRRKRYIRIPREQAPGCVLPADFPTRLAQQFLT